MNIKFVFALTALLLLQCCSGKPTSSEDTSKQSYTTSEEKALDAREDEIVTNLLNELNELSEISARDAKKLIKDVLDDLNAIEDKSDGIKAKIAKLTEADSEVDRINSDKQEKPFGDKFYLLARIPSIMGVPYTANGEKSDDDLFIETSLKNHGRLIMHKEFEEKFIRACKQFHEDVNDYWNSLSAEQQQEKELLGNWVKGFDEATADVNKMTKFLERVIDLKD